MTHFLLIASIVLTFLFVVFVLLIVKRRKVQLQMNLSFNAESWYRRQVEKVYWIIVKMMPARLQYQTFNYVFSYSTTGDYGSTNITAVTAIEVSRRFLADHKL